MDTETEFLDKLLQRLKGYACGHHKQLTNMIKNRQKRLKQNEKYDYSKQILKNE